MPSPLSSRIARLEQRAGAPDPERIAYIMALAKRVAANDPDSVETVLNPFGLTLDPTRVKDHS